LPAGPPLSARLAVLARRARALLGLVRLPRLGHRSRRLGFGLAFTVLLTGLVLAVPVVSGAGSGSSTGATPVALDAATTSSARSQSQEPVVVMGVDGQGGAPTASSSAPSAGSSTTRVKTPQTDSAASQAAADAADLPASSASKAAGSATSAAAAAPAATSSQSSSSSATASASAASSSASSSSASSSAPRSAPSPVENGDVETQLGALVALARGEAGCAGSDVDTGLADLARAHSAEMKKDGALAPLDHDARGVVANGETDPNVVVTGWLADPAARATLLDCSATKLGVGVANGHNGPWYTLTLG
jgi:uncharacterized protein YkwD